LVKPPTYIVKLNELPDNISEKPVANVTVNQNGNTLTLTCTATGNPVPVVYWEKDNGDGQFDPLGGTGEKRVGQNVLEVELSQETYGTTYQCVASNTQDNDTYQYVVQGGHLFSSYLL